MEFKDYIYNSLKSLYGNKVFDVDDKNVQNRLSSDGWNISENYDRPDFLILDFNKSNILIELKEIEKIEEDIKTQRELTEKLSTYYWEPDLLEIFKRKIKKSNKQFKKFIDKNSNLLRQSITILLLKCNRITANFTIEDAEKFVYGEVIEMFNPFGDNNYEIKNKVLNKKVFTSISCIGIWDGIEKFIIYHNKYNIHEFNVPIFITKKDINYFLLKDSLLNGIRVKKYKTVNYNRKEDIKYLVDNCFVDESDLSDYLIKLKEKLKKIKKEQIRILSKKKS